MHVVRPPTVEQLPLFTVTVPPGGTPWFVEVEGPGPPWFVVVVPGGPPLLVVVPGGYPVLGGRPELVVGGGRLVCVLIATR